MADESDEVRRGDAADRLDLLTPDQRRELREIFSFFAKDGRVFANEVGNLVRSLGYWAPTEAELQSLAAAVKEDCGDSVNFEQLCVTVLPRHVFPHCKSKDAELEELHQAFEELATMTGARDGGAAGVPERDLRAMMRFRGDALDENSYTYMSKVAQPDPATSMVQVERLLQTILKGGQHLR